MRNWISCKKLQKAYLCCRGFRVIGIDTGSEKEQLVKKLGGDKWIDFKTEKDIVKAVQSATPDGLGPHGAIVAAATAASYEQALEYLRPHGVCVAVGLPPDTNMKVNVFWTVFQSKRVVGSYVGNRQDAIEALEIAATGKVKTLYKIQPLGDLPGVYGRCCQPIFKAYLPSNAYVFPEQMHAGQLTGRVVLDMNK
jgi:propanol-preferring alcohol dehydrogenase